MSVQVYRGGGCFEAQPLDALVTALESARLPLVPSFPRERIELVGRFAAHLQRDRRWRGVAPVLALAFWLRKAAVTRMAEAFRARSHPQACATGRGLAFHLPPQNVDTLFLYSWAIAFLCGNANVVRLPEQASPTILDLLDPLIALLDEVGSGDVFLTYPRADSAVNARLSRVADCRLVWGGDAKAALFNELPVRVGGKSLMFADRYSHAVVSAQAIVRLDEAATDQLAKSLHDDIRLFDQQACSSPHTIHVLDAGEGALAAVHRLLEKVDILAREAPSTAPAHGMAKFTATCALAVDDSLIGARRLSNETTVVELAPSENRGVAIGGGFLSLRVAGSVAEVAETLTARDQTLTHFGLDGPSFAQLGALAASRGVARLVPIGSALNFDQLWDGYDLVAELTRVVRVAGFPERDAAS